MEKQEIGVISRSVFLGKEIDVYGTADEPLFKAKDVADWIGHSNPSKMVEDAELDENEVAKFNLGTLTNGYTALFLTEDGLYEVLMQSRKPVAKQFKKGVKTATRPSKDGKAHSWKVLQPAFDKYGQRTYKTQSINPRHKSSGTTTCLMSFSESWG